MPLKLNLGMGLKKIEHQKYHELLLVTAMECSLAGPTLFHNSFSFGLPRLSHRWLQSHEKWWHCQASGHLYFEWQPLCHMNSPLCIPHLPSMVLFPGYWDHVVHFSDNTKMYVFLLSVYHESNAHDHPFCRSTKVQPGITILLLFQTMYSGIIIFFGPELMVVWVLQFN